MYSVDRQWCLESIHTLLLSRSIPLDLSRFIPFWEEGCGSTQDVIDGPHCNCWLLIPYLYYPCFLPWWGSTKIKGTSFPESFKHIFSWLKATKESQLNWDLTQWSSKMHQLSSFSLGSQSDTTKWRMVHFINVSFFSMIYDRTYTHRVSHRNCHVYSSQGGGGGECTQALFTKITFVPLTMDFFICLRNCCQFF